MEFSIKSIPFLGADAEGLLLFSFEGGPSNQLKEIDKSLGGRIGRAFKRGEFKGKEREVYSLSLWGEARYERIILAGLGQESRFNKDKVRMASALGVKEARRFKLSYLAIAPMGFGGCGHEETLQLMVEGCLLGTYRFDRLKTKGGEDGDVKGCVFITETDIDMGVMRQGIERGIAIAESVNHVRDLINSPGNIITPKALAREAKRIARGSQLTCKVLNLDDIKRLGMNAFLSVAKGSAEPGCIIIMEYRGVGGREKPVVLAGKAVTFDSGGISIKPSKNMEQMKYDMAGGGAVIGVIEALARLKLPVNVVGIIPATENLPGGRATKPGDVVKSMSGKTIEIISTDAEGRMILADALSYALRYKPRVIIDLATLTGACVVALGRHAIGMMGNNRKYLDMIREAGEASGERVWELPIWEEYEDLIKSDVADMKNVGDRSAGTIVGAIFLKHFVEDTPWVHLDIAGTAWADKESAYQPKGATGVGVRLLIEFLEHLIEDE